MVKGRLFLVAGTIVGVIVTAYFAAKKAPEAQKRKEAALQEKREKTGDENAQLTFVESLESQAGAYIPAIISGAATIGTLVGSEVVNERTIRTAEKKIEDFKNMTERLEGKGAVKTIEKAVEQKKLDEKSSVPWTEKEIFRIVFGGRSIQFEQTRDRVMAAIYELNRRFHSRGLVTFNMFLEYMGQPKVEGGDVRGWEQYIGEKTYGYSWIDVGLKPCEDEPWVTEIYMPVYPHFLDETDVDIELEYETRKISEGDAFMTRLEESERFVEGVNRD